MMAWSSEKENNCEQVHPQVGRGVSNPCKRGPATLPVNGGHKIHSSVLLIIEARQVSVLLCERTLNAQLGIY